MPWVQEREHRVASYNKGCRCDDCRGAKRGADARRRHHRYQNRERREGDVMCLFCGCWFSPKGLGRHELACDG